MQMGTNPSKPLFPGMAMPVSRGYPMLLPREERLSPPSASGQAVESVKSTIVMHRHVSAGGSHTTQYQTTLQRSSPAEPLPTRAVSSMLSPSFHIRAMDAMGGGAGFGQECVTTAEEMLIPDDIFFQDIFQFPPN
jgi:hypothetical protein